MQKQNGREASQKKTTSGNQQLILEAVPTNKEIAK
jgi:hypothetical protein